MQTLTALDARAESTIHGVRWLKLAVVYLLAGVVLGIAMGASHDFTLRPVHAPLDGDLLEVASEGGTGSGANIMDFSHDAHRAVLQDFVDAVQHGRSPRVTGEEALATHRVIDRVLA